ncbi:MAG: 2-amino-4-hydroxy-6-hydroxymethyldihydropteridine diphosphokinase [Verrucomicrobiota bacterium]
MKVGVALGSNLGLRQSLLEQALVFLQETDPELRPSHWYVSQPVDCPEGAPDFINGFVEMNFTGDLHALLKDLQQFEQHCGRLSLADRPLNAPRPLDLDIIYADDEVWQTQHLILPHPRAHERLFVLQPMCDVCPQRLLPGQKKTISELRQSLVERHPELLCQKIP